MIVMPLRCWRCRHLLFARSFYDYLYAAIRYLPLPYAGHFLPSYVISALVRQRQ